MNMEATEQTKVDPQALLKNEESYIAQQQYLGYARNRDNGHTKYVKDAKLFDGYYIGEGQWDESVTQVLDAEQRPYHTVNLVLSTVNTVEGEYVATRQDIEYRPKSGDATMATASALTKIVKGVSDDSHSRWVEKQVFMDGVIQDRGFFDIRLDYTENAAGEIRETALDPVDVVLDAGAREYDPSTWNEVYYTRWLTPDQVEGTYGRELAEKLVSCDPSSTYGIDSVEFAPSTFSQRPDFYTNGQASVEYRGEERNAVKRVRIIERQHYKFTTRKYLIDNATGDMAPVPDSWSAEKAMQVAQTYNLSVTIRPERRIRWTVTCDKYVLKDGWSPYRRFTIIPFFCYFRRGRPFGVVRNLISPQDLLNKSLSQELHVVNTTANSGWMFEAGTLVNMTAQELAARGAKTGLVLEYQRGAQPPAKIQPNQIPTGLDRLSTKATMYFREISGVSDAMLGQPGREISGEALAAKNQRGLIQMDPIFDNLSFTRQLRAEMMLEIIQDYYTEERLYKVLGVNDEGEETSEEVVLNQVNAVGQILNDVTVGEYAVSVSARPTRDVEDDSQLQLMLQMRETGILIPDWAIIEKSPLENRRQIADWIRKMQGAAEPTEQEVMISQLQQELELRHMVATVEELQAKTQERLANAQKLLTEAEAMGEKERMEILKFGAELRAGLERDMMAFQQQREELMTRIAIAREKNAAANYQAQLQTLSKRLDTEARERTETEKARATISAARGYGKSFNGGKK